MAYIGNMEDIQSLLKETIAEFMENGLDVAPDDELGFWTINYTVSEVHVFKTLKENNNPDPSPIKEIRFGLFCFGAGMGI